MRSRVPVVLSLLAAAALLAEMGHAAVIFSTKDKGRLEAPGEEQVNGTAQQLFEAAQAAENAGDLKRAIKDYRAVVRKYPRDTLAPGAAYQFAILNEKTGDYLRAADAYRVMVEKYPKSPHFNEAIEAQFRIAEMYLAGKKVKFLGIPIRTNLERAQSIFAGIVSSAPYGPYTARAQFNIGRVAERQGNADLAVAAYQAVVEKYPNDPIAADAQYQIGYIWFVEARNGSKDAKAAEKSKIGFQDFLFRYPKSEKTAQARQNLQLLERKQTSDAYSIAKFYDKQKNYRAAVIYYNDVIRQQPGSADSDRAKRRVAELKAKVGEKNLQSPELTAATARPPKKSAVASEGSGRPGLGPASGQPPMRTSPGDVEPLPPPEADESLPPPASMMPDTTTAPDASPTPEASASPR